MDRVSSLLTREMDFKSLLQANDMCVGPRPRVASAAADLPRVASPAQHGARPAPPLPHLRRPRRDGGVQRGRRLGAPADEHGRPSFHAGRDGPSPQPRRLPRDGQGRLADAHGHARWLRRAQGPLARRAHRAAPLPRPVDRAHGFPRHRARLCLLLRRRPVLYVPQGPDWPRCPHFRPVAARSRPHARHAPFRSQLAAAASSTWAGSSPPPSP